MLRSRDRDFRIDEDYTHAVWKADVTGSRSYFSEKDVARDSSLFEKCSAKLDY